MNSTVRLTMFSSMWLLIGGLSLSIAGAEPVMIKSVESSYMVCSLGSKTSELKQIGSNVEHGGGLNGCGCHFNRKTGECHCHRAGACGCTCQPASCR
jgi:hypothetical protein